MVRSRRSTVDPEKLVAAEPMRDALAELAEATKSYRAASEVAIHVSVPTLTSIVVIVKKRELGSEPGYPR